MWVLERTSPVIRLIRLLGWRARVASEKVPPPKWFASENNARYHTREMSERFFKLTAIVTPFHIVATIVCNFLALRTIFEDVRHLTYLQRLYVFLADIFVHPLTAILDRFGIDFGSSPWEL